MSNHEMAKRYMDKQKLIGREVLELRLLDNDKVELIEVLDKADIGRLVIPSFITGMRGYLGYGVLKGCRYREVYIDNKDGIEISGEYLCAGMESDELVVNMRYSEMLVNMRYMFSGCSANRIDIRGLDTKNVEDMSGLYYYCSNIEHIDLRGVNTSKVKHMENMFSGCSKLESVDMSGLDLSKVRHMMGMFRGSSKIRSINLINTGLHDVIDMKQMFYNCFSVESIRMGKLELPMVSDIRYMFNGCVKLRDLDMDLRLTNKNAIKVGGIFNRSYLYSKHIADIKYINSGRLYIEDGEVKVE